ncbi:MAG TPA: hypothetical protein VF831_09100, partial [Anaerolineales bacterium]
QHAFHMVRLYQKNVLPFVESHLGFSEMHNLRSVWQAAIIPIHEADSDEDKYESAYSNWLWMARCSHDTLADLLSSTEVLEYKRLLLHLYEQQGNNPYLTILRLLRPPIQLAKPLLYEMQWLTPLEITRSDKAGVTCAVRDCKILRTAGTMRVCRVDCQQIGREYARKVYQLKRVTVQSDHSCEISLTPLEPQEE